MCVCKHFTQDIQAAKRSRTAGSIYGIKFARSQGNSVGALHHEYKGSFITYAYLLLLLQSSIMYASKVDFVTLHLQTVGKLAYSLESV